MAPGKFSRIAARHGAPVAGEASTKAQAWALFDRIVAAAAPGGAYGNPWIIDESGRLQFVPDYRTLERLLGVPLHLKATTQSGVPALALDVWLAYELRRAGFSPDGVWPRATNPRILPAAVAAVIESLPRQLRSQIEARISRKTSVKGATSSAATILGKNYLKQVDVVIADWWTGPELLVSTKRMDSSYGKNAPNRIEESYGDAKNLRLRHPLAALGFMFGLRSDILALEPRTADWLFDLLMKLGREDDAYNATCLVLMEYGGEVSPPEVGEGEPASVVLEPEPEPEADEPAGPSDSEMDRIIQGLPSVTVRIDKTPEGLMPDRFLARIVGHVLDTTPVNFHRDARERRLAAVRR